MTILKQIPFIAVHLSYSTVHLMFKVIYSYMIIIALMGFVLVPIIHAEENSEVNGSEKVSDKGETTKSTQEINEQNQHETRAPHELSDRAPDSIPEEILQ